MHACKRTLLVPYLQGLATYAIQNAARGEYLLRDCEHVFSTDVAQSLHGICTPEKPALECIFEHGSGLAFKANAGDELRRDELPPYLMNRAAVNWVMGIVIS